MRKISIKYLFLLDFVQMMDGCKINRIEQKRKSNKSATILLNERISFYSPQDLQSFLCEFSHKNIFLLLDCCSLCAIPAKCFQIKRENAIH